VSGSTVLQLRGWRDAFDVGCDQAVFVGAAQLALVRWSEGPPRFEILWRERVRSSAVLDAVGHDDDVVVAEQGVVRCLSRSKISRWEVNVDASPVRWREDLEAWVANGRGVIWRMTRSGLETRVMERAGHLLDDGKRLVARGGEVFSVESPSVMLFTIDPTAGLGSVEHPA
jgi:hypothetical protein